MSDTRALANFVKMAHLRNCGSNLVTDCGEECGYEKDMAFHQLGNLTERLAAVEKDRDRVWCRALVSTLKPEEIARVTAEFNRLRPDLALAPSAQQSGEQS